jgi:nucleoside-diphosphate-sugar epimerase
MSRVLVTDGTNPLGVALVRRLLRDPAYDVRVADERPAPQWMREGCEIHAGDVREPGQARRAVEGCPLVVHLATAAGPFTALEATVGLVRAALDAGVERFLFVAGGEDAAPAEAACRAAGSEHGLPFALCRVAGEHADPPSADRLADEIVAVLAAPASSVELGEMC